MQCLYALNSKRRAYVSLRQLKALHTGLPLTTTLSNRLQLNSSQFTTDLIVFGIDFNLIGVTFEKLKTLFNKQLVCFE